VERRPRPSTSTSATSKRRCSRSRAEVGDEIKPLARLLEDPWDNDDGLDAARALVDGFVTYWDRHRAVLRTRNLAAQEGDARFREVRNGTLIEFTARFDAKVAASRANGAVSPAMSAPAAAAALVALIERMAAFTKISSRWA
jgi:hypothetical protein